MRALLNHTVYCASKGAVDQLTRVMALDLGPHQVKLTSDNMFKSNYLPVRTWTNQSFTEFFNKTGVSLPPISVLQDPLQLYVFCYVS